MVQTYAVLTLSLKGEDADLIEEYRERVQALKLKAWQSGRNMLREWLDKNPAPQKVNEPPLARA